MAGPQGFLLETANGIPSLERNSEILSTDEVVAVPGTAAASITIGLTSALAGTAAGLGWLADSAPYDVYNLHQTTVWDEGRIQMPGTGVGFTPRVSAVLTSHGGMMTIYTAWVCQRTGAPPQLPTYQSLNPNIVPMGYSIVADSTVTSADGANMVYMLAGYYVHAVLDPTQYQIQSPVMPAYNQSVFNAAADAASFWNSNPLWNSSLISTSEAENANPSQLDGALTIDLPEPSQDFQQPQYGAPTSQTIQEASVPSLGNSPSQADFFTEPQPTSNSNIPNDSFFWSPPLQ